jgi:hypothetical protein
VIQGTGNGIEHSIVNNTGDGCVHVHLHWNRLSFHLVDHLSTSAVVTAAPNAFSIAHC